MVDAKPKLSKLDPVWNRVREEALGGLGLTVLRFTNDRVLENMNAVLDDIRQILIAARGNAARSPSPRSGEGARG